MLELGRCRFSFGTLRHIYLDINIENLFPWYCRGHCRVTKVTVPWLIFFVLRILLSQRVLYSWPSSPNPQLWPADDLKDSHNKYVLQTSHSHLHTLPTSLKNMSLKWFLMYWQQYKERTPRTNWKLYIHVPPLKDDLTHIRMYLLYILSVNVFRLKFGGFQCPIVVQATCSP